MFLNITSPNAADPAGIEHIDALYDYAMVLTRYRSEAEDLVQETYVRAIKAMVNLRDDSNVKSWLFTIPRNIWLNQLRQRRATPEVVEIDVDESTANYAVELSKGPYALYVRSHERQQVRNPIQQLSVDFREFATLLNCTAGTVMSRLGRARAKLHTLLSTAMHTSYSEGKEAVG
jgi:RNA polymerase sigma-70 factor (ECF subfamily)